MSHRRFFGSSSRPWRYRRSDKLGSNCDMKLAAFISTLGSVVRDSAWYNQMLSASSKEAMLSRGESDAAIFPLGQSPTASGWVLASQRECTNRFPLSTLRV